MINLEIKWTESDGSYASKNGFYKSIESAMKHTLQMLAKPENHDVIAEITDDEGLRIVLNVEGSTINEWGYQDDNVPIYSVEHKL